MFRIKFEDVCVNMNDKNEINVLHVYFDNTFDFQDLERKSF